MKKKIIFIGNSIVAGYPWSKGKSFPSILRSSLKLAFKNTGFDVINKGVNGDTTKGIMERLERDVLCHNPDIVFIFSGTNDFIYREADPEETFANLDSMAQSIGSTGAIPVLMSPIPVECEKASHMWMAGMGISYPAVNRQIERLSSLITASQWLHLDMNSLYNDFVREVGDPELSYLDGIHPMPAGYEYIARCTEDFIIEESRTLGIDSESIKY